MRTALRVEDRIVMIVELVEGASLTATVRGYFAGATLIFATESSYVSLK